MPRSGGIVSAAGLAGQEVGAGQEIGEARAGPGSQRQAAFPLFIVKPAPSKEISTRWTALVREGRSSEARSDSTKVPKRNTDFMPHSAFRCRSRVRLGTDCGPKRGRLSASCVLRTGTIGVVSANTRMGASHAGSDPGDRYLSGHSLRPESSRPASATGRSPPVARGAGKGIYSVVALVGLVLIVLGLFRWLAAGRRPVLYDPPHLHAPHPTFC